MPKPILCLDFDGVLHSYESGWQGADVIPDPPVEGAVQFIYNALQSFRVAIFSSRSNQEGGIEAMKTWLQHHMTGHCLQFPFQYPCETFAKIEWPRKKPPAMISIDDRAITFDGVFPDPQVLLGFRPWNKQDV